MADKLSRPAKISRDRKAPLADRGSCTRAVCGLSGVRHEGICAAQVAYMESLKARGLELYAAYGNTTTDIRAYAAAGIPKVSLTSRASAHTQDSRTPDKCNGGFMQAHERHAQNCHDNSTTET